MQYCRLASISSGMSDILFLPLEATTPNYKNRLSEKQQLVMYVSYVYELIWADKIMKLKHHSMFERDTTCDYLPEK